MQQRCLQATCWGTHVCTGRGGGAEGRHEIQRSGGECSMKLPIYLALISRLLKLVHVNTAGGGSGGLGHIHV